MAQSRGKAPYSTTSIAYDPVGSIRYPHIVGLNTGNDGPRAQQ